MAEKETKHGKGFSFWNESNQRWYMIRCHECGSENYSLSVSSGICWWCGHDANAVPETELVSCRVCGMEHEWVRPGKSQPKCTCHETAIIE